MDAEWDEARRLSNLGKHGLDFEDAILVLDGPHLLLPARVTRGEERQLAIGLLRGRHVALILTRRGDAVRVISMRRARDGERRQHHATFGG